MGTGVRWARSGACPQGRDGGGRLSVGCSTVGTSVRRGVGRVVVHRAVSRTRVTIEGVGTCGGSRSGRDRCPRRVAGVRAGAQRGVPTTPRGVPRTRWSGRSGISATPSRRWRRSAPRRWPCSMRWPGSTSTRRTTWSSVARRASRVCGRWPMPRRSWPTRSRPPRGSSRRRCVPWWTWRPATRSGWPAAAQHWSRGARPCRGCCPGTPGPVTCRWPTRWPSARWCSPGRRTVRPGRPPRSASSCAGGCGRSRPPTGRPLGRGWPRPWRGVGRGPGPVRKGPGR